MYGYILQPFTPQKTRDKMTAPRQKCGMKTIKLSISVMAHPSRAQFFPYLQEKLGLSLSQFSIDQKNNLIENCKASWLLHDSTADFHCVVQDDAVICDHFREKATAFIAEQEKRRAAEGKPAQGYNFFLKQDRRKTPLWVKDGVYTDNVTRGGVAICLPVSHIKPMLIEFDRQRSRHDDDRISEYIKRRRMKILFPVPSFIGHRGDIDSVAGNPRGLDVWKFDGQEPVTIPKIIHQLWVGPNPPPLKWMDTWKEKNPAWQYRLWGNDEIRGAHWENQKHLDYYWQRKIWHGVSDVCTYEILYHNGGFMIGADSICLNPIDELYYNDYDAYSVYEHEQLRPGLISPLHACKKGSQFARELIDGLRRKDAVGEPWKTVGNQYMGEMFRKTRANVKIFPSHYFNWPHFADGKEYAGPDKIYARQQWGTSRQIYARGVKETKEGETEMEKILNGILSETAGKKFLMLADGQIDYILKNLASVIDVPGDVVELGCNVGVTSSYLQRFIKAAGVDKKLYVYDSFEGLPPKTAEDGATPCDAGASAVSIEQFKKTFADAGVELPIINKGFFGSIADAYYPDKICFAFFDGDFYSSIMDSFKKVYDKMVPGGVILIHDYKWLNFPGVLKACEDFLVGKPEKTFQEIFGIGKMVKQ